MPSTGHRLNWENSVLKPDIASPEGNLRPSVHERWMRLLGLLLVGIAIPRFALLFEKFTWTDGLYWVATAWFLFTAVAIWESNRLLALRLRAHLDWLVHPVWKVAILAAANLACTIPLTIAAVWLWLRFVNSPHPLLDWLGTIRVVATNNAITVLFLLHAYETLFLIRERHGDQRRLEHLERARLRTELENMKGQLAPHFLFNCLNTLAALIETNPPAAAEFNARLADVTRYLLAQKNHDLVPLPEELSFLHSYVRLMELRFPDSLKITLPPAETRDPRRIPPASLQLLLENAIKHNRHSAAEPLAICIELAGDAIVVTNPLRPKATLASGGTATGLANLRERIALLTPGTLSISREHDKFSVRVPLAPPAP